jgi:hypothetical protein
MMAGLGLGISSPTAPETCTPFAIHFGGQGARAEMLGTEELVMTEKLKIR